MMEQSDGSQEPCLDDATSGEASLDDGTMSGEVGLDDGTMSAEVGQVDGTVSAKTFTERWDNVTFQQNLDRLTQ